MLAILPAHLFLNLWTLGLISDHCNGALSLTI